MGFLTYTVAGAGFFLIGTLETLFSASKTHSSPPPLNQVNAKPPPPLPEKNRATSFLSFIAVAVLSFLFISDSVVSLSDALDFNDRVGSALQLQTISVASLFLLYAVLGIVTHVTDLHPLPSSLLSLICLFAFVEEFLLFYLQRKDSSGIENRYFDLLLVPITICVCSTILELRSPKSSVFRLARGVGLIGQGTWFLQMGVSFFTGLISHGCSLHEKSRGNYTIRCKGHPEYHRGRAIATLQFNCHLAFLVIVIVGVYSIISPKDRRSSSNEFTRYRPLGAEMQHMETQSQFTLDSDEEVDELNEEEIVLKQKDAVVVSGLGINGYGSHQ